MAIEFACPECDHPVRTNDSQGGKKGRCPSCRVVFTIPATTADTTTSQSVEKTIRYVCHQCQKKLKVPVSLADKKITCPQCGTSVTNTDIKSSGSLSGILTSDGRIEFPCGECGHTVQTPFEQAGKKGRCPECQQIMQIPIPQTNPASEQKSSRFSGTAPPPQVPAVHDDLATSLVADSHESLDDFVDWQDSSSAPTVSRLPGSGSQGGTRYRVRAPRKGLPWESDSNNRSRFWKTVTTILFSPQDAFSRMYCENGTRGSLGFALSGQLVGAGITIGFLLIFVIIALVSGILYAPEDRPVAVAGSIMYGVVGSLILVAATLVATALNVLLQGFALSAFQHVGLTVVRGSYQTFETTCRVVGYVWGSLGPLMILTPIVGLPLQLIALPVYVGIGCYAAHETTKGQAIGGTLIGFLAWYGILVGGWMATQQLILNSLEELLKTS